MRLSYEQLAKIWRASASDSHLTRDDVASVHIDGVSEALLDSAASLSLRAEGHFVYGISQIWRSKAQLLFEDSKCAEANIGTAFREYLESIAISSSGGSRGAGLTGLDIGELLNIPESLLSSSSRANDPDRSVDLVVRGGEVDMPDELSDGENVPRSAEENAVLEGLDFGLDVPNSDGEADMEPGALDFGSDLPYSSSPPHTPTADLEAEVQIDAGSSSPHIREIPAKRRKRGTPIDEIITIVRPRKPSDKILRSPPTPPAPVSSEAPSQDEFYIPLDADTERLLDPDYVEEEMRRRRRGASADMHVVEPEQSVDFGHVDLGDDSLDFGDIVEDDADVEETDEYDSPEKLENEQMKARETVRKALRRRGDHVEFEELASTACAKASVLMEVLHLATKGKVRPAQREAWGSIDLVKT